jgi:hypothetical protein
MGREGKKGRREEGEKRKREKGKKRNGGDIPTCEYPMVGLLLSLEI